MKKLSWGVLALMLTMFAAGCGAKDDGKEGAAPSAGEAGGTASADGAGAKVYLIGTDASYAPMESMDKDKIVGFDVDFLEAVMKEAGLDYKLENAGWDPLFTDLESKTHKYDAGISAISITDDRKGTFDFSMPYFESVNMILTKEDSAIANAQDLKDKKVAVQGATTAEELMKGIMGETNASLKRFDSNTVALLELEKGGVDAVVADFAVVQSYVQSHPDKKFKAMFDKTNFQSEYYGIMLPKGSELKAKLDPAIEKVRSSDAYKEMYKKWLGVEPDTTDLLKTK
ncbi:basic amino acid ABC transporter substrate-binding protein [Cohnella nanjingensis]|uniref:Basic amino acid ABC transporter substrate-binding protein n=1 Tax=Cohnella nanjingensis TaxID=1387779 RepID=A0A7X0RU10_9BACL|nr:basic amino acid ABC transporter substrate-binding protein [Cohnella nanjingensis]MBB6673521.1 basic amino acid ABC transporter substrate-binding protein [Cohnella nanjingensis]